MFSHVMVGSTDLDKAKLFYDAVFATLGMPEGTYLSGRLFYPGPAGNFFVTKPINGEPATFANGGTIGFNCASPEQADAWHAAGLAHGGTSCEDPPGVRTRIVGQVYLAYMRDPDGNKLCGIYRY